MTTKHKVELYIYDLSQGMAKVMSPMLLGKQLQGIWHTAIVIYNKEFFYGGDGIGTCQPGGTVLKQPQEIVELGHTEVDEIMFMEYLSDMGGQKFHGGKYDLFDHNCNTFSNEVSHFLTGSEIPSHITSLPSDIMGTPMGQWLRPIVEQMKVTVPREHTVPNYTHVAGGSGTTPQQKPVTPTSDNKNDKHPFQHYQSRDKGASAGSNKQSNSDRKKGERSKDESKHNSSEPTRLTNAPIQLPMDYFKKHVENPLLEGNDDLLVICRCSANGNIPAKNLVENMVAAFEAHSTTTELHQAAICSLALSIKKEWRDYLPPLITRLMNALPGHDQNLLQRPSVLLLASCASHSGGVSFILTFSSLVCQTVTGCLQNSEDTDMHLAALQLAHNLSLFSLPSDMVMDIATPLLHLIEIEHASHQLLTMQACIHLLRQSTQAAGLAKIMGIRVNTTDMSAELRKVANVLNELIDM